MFTLRSFFNWCVAENLCRRNPALDVQLDRVDRKGRSRFADLDLAQCLIENAPTDDLPFVLFCGFHTGMRKLEIVEAVPEWFDLRAKTVEIRTTGTFRPKDRDARTVPLTDQFAPDVTTLEEMLEAVERKHGRARRVWVFDRGIVSEENLQRLRRRGASYLVGTPRAQLKAYERRLLEGDWQSVCCEVEVQLIAEDNKEAYVLARSRARPQKESAMRSRVRARL